MDPIRNPYTPGAGSPPPELAGRDEVIRDAQIAIERIRLGRFSKSLILVGLRGVGKTVLLERLRQNAETEGAMSLRIEAEEGRGLPETLVPQLRGALIRLSRVEKAKDLATRGLRALAGFASAMKITYNDVEIGVNITPEPGLADNGDLVNDLQELMVAAGKAAQEADKVLVFFIDELQYVKEDELAALITALHRCSQERLPVTMVAAGLPQLRGQMGNAKSYAERLFEFPLIGALEVDQKTKADPGRDAIIKPAQEEGVEFAPDAVETILEQTKRYPYFLQEWGKHAWDAAAASPITRTDVLAGAETAILALDESFFRVRFDRLTPHEKRYVRAMAELGEGPHRSGEIANEMNRDVSSLAPTRGSLIKKGMIWSPAHGQTAFTVPLFHEFMRRVMPGDDWRTPNGN
jgi:hypothetical protein